MMMTKPGDRVRLTGAFLRSTGQHTGPEGLSRWRVVQCDCGLCRRGGFTAVDEQGEHGPRHIATANLERAQWH
jgi:hypothetical protein